MPKLTPQQLQTWYSDLRTVLYRQANVDLTHKEDLGMVHVLRINNWDYNNPETHPRVDHIYPFIPHRPLARGEKSPDPELEHYRYNETPPDRSDMDTYNQWMFDHMSTDLSNDQLQELYDLSQEGYLMVSDSGQGGDFRQIRTIDGNVVLSDPMSVIAANGQTPEPPVPVAMPEQAPGPFLPIKPVQPPEPGEAPTGLMAWFSWVGYVFGANTEYAQYMARKKLYDDYPKQVSQWETTCNNIRTAWAEEYPEQQAQFNQQLNAYNNYIREATEYFSNPLVRHSLATAGYGTRFYEMDDDTRMNQLQQEYGFWRGKHNTLPQGQLQTEMDSAKEKLAFISGGIKSVHQAFGPKFEQPFELVSNDVISAHTKVSPYGLITNPALTRQQAAVICFATLFSGEVMAEDHPNTPELENLDGPARAEKVFMDLFVDGKTGSDNLFPYLLGARKKGAELMRGYALGNSESIARALGNCLRKQIEYAKYTDGDNARTLRIFSYTAQIIQLMDQHPDLYKQCGLNPEEITQARANAQLYQMNCDALKAKSNLMSHALYQKDLSPEQLNADMRDVMFLYTMDAQVADGKDLTGIMSSREAVQEAKDILMKDGVIQLSQATNMDRDALGSATMNPTALFTKLASHSNTPIGFESGPDAPSHQHNKAGITHTQTNTSPPTNQVISP